MTFNDDFLRRQADPNDLSTLVLRQGSAIRQIGQSFVRVQSLDEIASAIGQLRYRAVDSDGRLRAIMSAINLLDEFGISAYLAGFDIDGVPQFWLSADDGSAVFAEGGVKLNKDGMLIADAGDAIVFSDTNTGSYVITSLRVVNGYPSYEIRVLDVYSETNLISNGDFATSDFTSWTETDPSSKLSVTTIDDEDALTIAPSASFTTTYLTQTLAGYPIGFNFRGMVVTFKARATHANNQVKVGTSTTQQNFVIGGTDEWVNVVAVVTGTVTDLRIGGNTGPTSTIYIKDIVVRILENNPEQYFLMNPIQTYIRGDVYISDTFSIHPKSIPGTSRFASGTHIAGAFFLDGVENSTTSGTHNDYWAVDPEGISIYRFNPSSALTLTGWRLGEPSPPVGTLYGGKTITILNVHTSNTITLINESASSTAENRFSLGADLVIPAGGMVTLWHDGTTQRWRLRSVNNAVIQYAINLAVTGLLELKGITDCSANPNYPSASKGDAYIVSVAGKIGGASGKSVDVGDWYIANADNAGGTEASVGNSWGVVEHNLTGVLLSANNLSDLANVVTARSNLGLVIGTNIREILTANRTYYVRTDGNDSNTGLADNSGGAFLTIQKAIDVTAALDMSIYDVTIQIRTGTYAEQVTLKQCVGAGAVYILGDTSTPANIVISGATAFTADGIRTLYNIQGVKGTGAGSFILASNGALVDFGNVNIANTGQQLRCADNATIRGIANYTISASATHHWVAVGGGVIRIQSKTITLTGTPAFSSQFAGFDVVGKGFVNGNTFSGPATGTRYLINSNSVLSTAGGGANYLPGNAAGSMATGGQYL